jgi:hypothetical protein
MFSTTHKETLQTITQPKVVNVHNDDKHENVQLPNEVVSIQQPWRFATPSCNLLRTSASTLITTYVSFQNQPSHTNIHLVPTNLKME